MKTTKNIPMNYNDKRIDTTLLLDGHTCQDRIEKNEIKNVVDREKKTEVPSKNEIGIGIGIGIEVEIEKEKEKEKKNGTTLNNQRTHSVIDYSTRPSRKKPINRNPNECSKFLTQKSTSVFLTGNIPANVPSMNISNGRRVEDTLKVV